MTEKAWERAGWIVDRKGMKGPRPGLVVIPSPPSPKASLAPCTRDIDDKTRNMYDPVELFEYKATEVDWEDTVRPTHDGVTVFPCFYPIDLEYVGPKAGMLVPDSMERLRTEFGDYLRQRAGHYGK